MATVFDYLDWRGDVPFSVDEFNEVDNLILAELAYTEFDGLLPDDGTEVPLKEVQKAFFEKHSREEIRKEENPIRRTPLLMDGMVSGARFEDMTLSNYVSIIDSYKDVQMAAVTFRLGDGTVYVAFRGTDTSVVGWKEDFIMSYLPETEGQRKAVEYLDQVGSKIRKPIRVGGHSKGGNFAVYAAAFCKEKVKRRIIEVYTHDGPGFRDEVMVTEEYKKILPKVVSIVPDTSIIGMLLTSKIEHRVVQSAASLIMQHDGLSWQIERNRFKQAELSELGLFIRNIQVDWLSKIGDKERESFVDTLFSLFDATGMGTFTTMKENKLKTAEGIISALQALPKEKQTELVKIIGKLIESGEHHVLSSVFDSLNELIGGSEKNEESKA